MEFQKGKTWKHGWKKQKQKKDNKRNNNVKTPDTQPLYEFFKFKIHSNSNCLPSSGCAFNDSRAIYIDLDSRDSRASKVLCSRVRLRVGFQGQAECNPPINPVVVQLVLFQVAFLLLFYFLLFAWKNGEKSNKNAKKSKQQANNKQTKSQKKANKRIQKAKKGIPNFFHPTSHQLLSSQDFCRLPMCNVCTSPSPCPP